MGLVRPPHFGGGRNGHRRADDDRGMDGAADTAQAMLSGGQTPHAVYVALMQRPGVGPVEAVIALEVAQRRVDGGGCRG